MDFHMHDLGEVIAANCAAEARGDRAGAPGPHPAALALHDITLALICDYPDRLSLETPIHLRAGDSGDYMGFWPGGLHLPTPLDTRDDALRLEVLHTLDALGFRAELSPGEAPTFVTGRINPEISAHRRMAIRAAIAPFRPGAPAPHLMTDRSGIAPACLSVCLIQPERSSPCA